jgi:hypothetical protein
VFPTFVCVLSLALLVYYCLFDSVTLVLFCCVVHLVYLVALVQPCLRAPIALYEALIAVKSGGVVVVVGVAAVAIAVNDVGITAAATIDDFERLAS